MNLNHLTLRTRLGGAFLLLVLLTAGLGGFAYLQLVRLHANADDLAANWLPGIKALASMRNDANAVRRSEADLAMSSEGAESNAAVRAIEERDKKVADSRANYVKMIGTPEEQKKYDEFSAHHDAYLATQKKLLALASVGDKGADQTRAYYRGDSRKTFFQAADDIGALIDINNKGAEDAHRAAENTFSQACNGLIGMVLGAIALACMLAFWMVRSVTRQLGGEPAEAASVAEAVAAGNLAQRIDVRNGDATSVMAQLKAMQQNLSAVVSNVRQNSESVATASAEIAQGNNDLSSRTEQQASALEETAASMEELSSTVKQNADNARQANQLAMSASTVAVKGGEVVSQVVDTMKGINDSSKKIADIISVIDGIAFQTNILALNAAVEAARAGEQGRGFAVVASEVRSLAGRSADAAKEIKTLITASVERVAHGTTLVDQAGATMTEVVSSIRRVTDIMGEISAASAEQSAGVAQIGEAVSQMDQATQQNAALVEESAAAAESLKTQAEQLVQAVAVFTLSGQASRASASNTAMVERRGPDRAKNVTRPTFGTKKAAAKSASAESAPMAKTGTDDEWTSF